jgi:hypothetical protein
MIYFIGKKIIVLALQKCEEKNEKRLLDSRSSVHPHQLGSQWTDFARVDIGTFMKIFQRMPNFVKIGSNIGQFTSRPK